MPYLLVLSRYARLPIRVLFRSFAYLPRQDTNSNQQDNDDSTSIGGDNEERKSSVNTSEKGVNECLKNAKEYLISALCVDDTCVEAQYNAIYLLKYLNVKGYTWGKKESNKNKDDLENDSNNTNTQAKDIKQNIYMNYRMNANTLLKKLANITM